VKILQFQAHNILGIKDVNLDLEGSHLFIVAGKNGQGKSSTLKAVQMILCGRSGMEDWPTKPIRDGEDHAFIEMKLSGSDRLHEPHFFTARMDFVIKRGVPQPEKFTITDSSGQPAGSARQMMSSLYKLRGFDPLEFSRMKPKEQRGVLCDLLGINLDEMNTERQKLYNERAVVNKQGVSKKALADAMPYHPDAPSEPIKLSELSARLEAAKESNREYNANTKKVAELENECTARALVIADLVRQLEDERAQLALADDMLGGQRRSLEAMVKIDIAPIEKEVAEADETNRKVAANQARKVAMEELESLRKESSDLTEAMKEIDEQQKDLLAAAKWPVPGMSVDADGVLLNGLPLEQVCQRDKTIVSANIGILQNPELRLMVSERGSELDIETRDGLAEILKNEDFQMIIEVVTNSEADEERCSVVIEDGAVKAKKAKV